MVEVIFVIDTEYYYAELYYNVSTIIIQSILQEKNLNIHRLSKFLSLSPNRFSITFLFFFIVVGLASERAWCAIQICTFLSSPI